jgi:hypothetical protein
VAVGVKPLIGYAADRAGLERAREELRGRLAFYASTAAYRPAFAHHGDEAIADKARGLVREGRWAELPDLVSDEVLDRYAFAGSPERVGARLRDRFGTLADRLEVPVPEDDGAHRLVPRLLDAVRGA